jgi:hypothetical protein
MTAQIPERLIYEGQNYFLNSNPLEAYFDDDHPRPEFRAESTANWRGYCATWEIENEMLYLIVLHGYVGGDHETYAINARKVCLQDVFPMVDDRVAATWFSGELRLPKGELIEYIHHGYGSTYEEDLLLTIEKGKLVRREIKDNRHLIPEIRKREEEEARHYEKKYNEILPYIRAIAEGRQPRWKEISKRDKIARIIAAPIIVIILPVLLPYVIYKHGLNVKKWNLF